MENLEIHTLICNRDLLLAINNFKSLQKYEEFKDTPIFLHDDGSLTESDISVLLKIKNVRVIRRKTADYEIRKFIEDKPNCLSYRLGDAPINLWHKIKLFDYYYFSDSKRILGVDTDLLFMKKPEEMIDYIKRDVPFYFPDIQSAYCFNEPKNEVPVIEKVNTGLIYIPSEEYFDIDSIEFALQNLVGGGVNYFPSWIEQSAFAHMFKTNGNYVSLSERAHTIPYFRNINIKDAECLHFVSYPAVRETYKSYLEYLEFDMGQTVYENNYVVKFKEHNIPLGLKVIENEGVFNFEYYWGLEETEHNFLDHIFKLEFDDLSEFVKKCQSEKNGFFIVNTDSLNIKVSHTYDWYGETEWVEIDTIKLK
jgi:hypothetical protein